MKQRILILDFGSQYTHLIKARLADLGVYSVIESGDITVSEFQKTHSDTEIKGIILSGGAQSVYDNHISFDEQWLTLRVPVLGICYGHQLLAHALGGEVKESKSEFGKESLEITGESLLWKGLTKQSIVWMSHRDTVVTLPDGFRSVASSSYTSNAAVEDSANHYYGIQFHPEVSHTENGIEVLKNFAFAICNVTQSEPWTPETFLTEISEHYTQQVGNGNIIFGLSGGVDSMTMAAVLRRMFSQEQLLAVYVDTGLMPPETQAEVERFCSSFDIPLVVQDSSDRFFEALKGVLDPTEKGMVIGRIFIEEFEKIAKTRRANFFAQGTIWSDVVESGVTKFSSRIKPHHNVGGLPERLNFILLEPFRELFKDQVRKIASYLSLPESVVHKKVFPGPGFAIRVQGEVTREKVKLVRECTSIVEGVIYHSEVNNDIWMAFAILIEVPSLGVKGDQRVENQHAIVVRIVESQNSMTVNFSQKAFPYLETISTRIVNETPIGRVVYDITNKPPATIEWQ